MRRLHAIVKGRVQGVGFRAFVLRQAQALGLTGTVRNIYFPWRQVEVIAEGPDAALQDLLDLLRAGPPMARVETIEITWDQATGEFADFLLL